MTTFPKNNLPADSLNWGREVEKSINNLETTFKSAEVNNVTRDAQLQNSYKRLDSALTQLATTNAAVDQAQSDAITALNTANTANSAAITATNTATTANATAIEALEDAVDALEALGALDESTSTYKINASNVTVGTMSADRISGGTIDGITITGGSLNTSPDGAGKSVSISGSSTSFLSGGSSVGSIQADGSGRVAVFSSAGIYLSGQTGVFGGGFSSEGGISTPGTYSSPGSSITSGGALIRNQLNGDGLGLTGASITSTGNFVRTSSSARYKQDIEDLDLPYEAILDLQPKTFRRIDEVEEQGDAAKVYAGFVAEDIADSELDIFAFYKVEEDGSKTPEGVHYPELTAALVLALKHQDQLIKSLTARIEALEA